MTRPTPPRSSSSPSPSRRSTTPILIVAVLVVVAALAALAIVLTGGDDDTTGTDDGGPDPMAMTIAATGDVLTPLDPSVPADDAIGMAAPTLAGSDYAGNPVTVTPGEDGPMMVVFLAHWCPHCNDEIPVLNEWRDAGGVPDDLRIVGVSTAVNDERPNYPPGEWLAEKDWQWDVIADGPPSGREEAPPAALAYGVSGFPFIVMVDADGEVTARVSGEQPIEVIEDLVATVT